ncbi:MAG: sigma 54-interacting transcriptional regulator [Gammaproteobacteria bacterium]
MPGEIDPLMLLEGIPAAYVVIDRDYRIVTANRRYAGQVDEPLASLSGKRCREFMPGGMLCMEAGDDPFRAVFEERCSVELVFRDQADRRLLQVRATPIDVSAAYPLAGVLFEEIRHLAEERETRPATELNGRSKPMLHLLSLLQRVAPTQTSVLITGESGVGKERVAHYIHHYSRRNARPLVIVDSASLGENLIESELFGHERGAFTGASARKIGLVESANGGTLFIDEIGELPLDLQTKLLRVLESGTIRRVGGNDYIPVDVRVIAATNRDLQEMVANGEFRQDLYYRLAAFPVQVPPLRERKDDILELVEHFLSRIEEGDSQIPLAANVIEALLTYDYPGNVRELRNIIERAVILACGEPIRLEHLVFDDLHDGTNLLEAEPDNGLSRSPEATAMPRTRYVDQDILAALERHRGHRSLAAKELGISERTLYRHLRRLKGV